MMIATLLILAAGFSQLSGAVIYTPVSFTHSVGTGELPGSTVFTFDLPGLNDLDVIDFSYSHASVPRSNFYHFANINPGTVFVATDLVGILFYAHSLNGGETWDNTSNQQAGANISRMEQTGDASVLLRSDPTYFPFFFTDTTDSSTKYGYIALATSVTGSGPAAQFTLNVSGYAYETSGAKIAMGAVPEPPTALAAALGILGILAALRFRRIKSVGR